jgi:hypothetical protein
MLAFEAAVRATEVVRIYVTSSCKINLEEVKFTISHIAFVLMFACCEACHVAINVVFIFIKDR